MRQCKKWQSAAVCLVALALVATALPRGGRAAQVAAYTVTDLGTLGGAQSMAYAINNCGRVVGESQVAAGDSHGFSWAGGQMTDLSPQGWNATKANGVNAAGMAAGAAVSTGSVRRAFVWTEAAGLIDIGTLGGSGAAAHGINDSGRVVGESEVAAGAGVITNRAFVWDSAGGMVQLPTLGGSSNNATGINNAGQITGTSATAGGETHAYFLSGGVLTDLGTLGTGRISVARTLNNVGEVVGFSFISTTLVEANVPQHAFVWSATTGMLDMGTLPGGRHSYAYDINNAGKAVGTSQINAAGTRHAFVYTRTGGMVDLNDLTQGSDWTLSEATSINDRGQIVGFGINPQGQTRAFLLTPVTPEGDVPPCGTPTPTPTPSPTPTPIPTPTPTPIPTPTPTPIPTPTPTPSPSPTPVGPVNVALASQGGVATASSTYDSRFPAAGVNNGDRKGLNWGNGGGWNDGTNNAYPDWVEISFAGAKTINEVDVFTVQDNFASPAEPTDSLTFTKYGVTALRVEQWTGGAWELIPGAQTASTNLVWRKFTFAPVTTTRIRVLVNNALNGHSRLVEVEAWQTNATPTPTPTPSPTPAPGRVNVALAANGATAAASSQHSANFPAAAAINGDRRGLNWGTGGGWNDGTPNAHPDSLEVTFSGSRTIDEIDVFTLQDNFSSPSEPTEQTTFSLYGVTEFEAQYWTGAAWAAVPGGIVAGNNKAWRKFTFAPVTTTKVRVLVRNALNGSSRLVEVEAWQVDATAPTRTNHALAANGGVASASSTYDSRFPVSSINNGDRRGLNWGAGGGWNDATNNAYPDWVEVAFSGAKTISEVNVFTVQDNFAAPAEPTEALTFTLYGVTQFDVQVWDGGAWVTVPGGGAVTGNNLVWRKVTFAPVTTTKIRVLVRNGLNGHSRVTEVEAY